MKFARRLVRAKRLLPGASFILFCLVFFALPAAAQETAKPASGSGAHSKTLWEQIKEGGWVMIPIAGCSILTVYLIGDGVLRTRAQRVAPPQHVDCVKDFFRGGDYVGAYQYCKTHPSPFCDVLRVGTGLLGDGKAVAEEGMMGELAKVNAGMNTYISYLSVIGVCTPMIGLLGTVTGMIKAFATLGQSGIGDPSSLSSAIGEVLVATASGLFIAIPAFGAYYFLRNRAAAAVHHVQDVLNTLFRKMPYDQLAGVHIGDEELFANTPNWLVPASPAADPAGAPSASPTPAAVETAIAS